MATATTIRVLCVKLNISVSELARRNGSSPQAFNQKLKRDGFTPTELNAIAESVGCKYESAFILPDGERIADQYPNVTKGVIAARLRTDADLERRCRYRFGLHGLKMHKVKGNSEPVYYLYEDGDDDSLPEEDERFFTLKELIDYCEELEEKDAIAREKQKSMGR